MEETVDSGNTSTDGTWFWRTYEMPHGTAEPYVTYESKHTCLNLHQNSQYITPRSGIAV